MKSLFLSVVVMFGIVDQIHGNYALIEYQTTAGDIRYLDIEINKIRCHENLREGLRVGLTETHNSTQIFCTN